MFTYIRQKLGISPLVRKVVQHMNDHPDRWKYCNCYDHNLLICHELEMGFSVKWKSTNLHTRVGKVPVNMRERRLISNTLRQIERDKQKEKQSQAESLLLRRLGR